MYRVNLFNSDNIYLASDWCYENLGCNPGINSSWIREWRGNAFGEKKVYFCFRDLCWASQFKLMGF